MDKEIQKINVRIGGMSYNLVSLESEQYTRQIAARADEMIRRVAMSSPQLSQQMTIILALTNAVDELTRQAMQQSIAEQQRDAAELKNSELRTELTRARETNWEMKKELLRLNALCRQYETESPALPPETPVATGAAVPSAGAVSRQTGATVPSTVAASRQTGAAVPSAGAASRQTGAAVPSTVAASRQTDMDELFSAFGQTKSSILEISKDDEP
jgi:cell division protein ZapA (FtsZ GTPase activity inhibitor)